MKAKSILANDYKVAFSVSKLPTLLFVTKTNVSTHSTVLFFPIHIYGNSFIDTLLYVTKLNVSIQLSFFFPVYIYINSLIDFPYLSLLYSPLFPLLSIHIISVSLSLFYSSPHTPSNSTRPPELLYPKYPLPLTPISSSFHIHIHHLHPHERLYQFSVLRHANFFPLLNTFIISIYIYSYQLTHLLYCLFLLST